MGSCVAKVMSFSLFELQKSIIKVQEVQKKYFCTNNEYHQIKAAKTSDKISPSAKTALFKKH